MTLTLISASRPPLTQHAQHPHCQSRPPQVPQTPSHAYFHHRSGTATAPSVQQVITDARRSSSSRYRHPSTVSGLRALFTSPFSASRKGPKQPAFRPTANKLPAEGPDAGPACRMYGSVGVKKVTANLHVTTLGHGYMSWEHTDHKCELSVVLRT